MDVIFRIVEIKSHLTDFIDENLLKDFKGSRQDLGKNTNEKTQKPEVYLNTNKTMAGRKQRHHF